ncbi:hypothetical protein GF314_04940 [bacterium]|nr:hypothetical protein [bacterium]
MARTAMIFGVLLILLGLLAYLGTGRDSATALIPAFFGLPLLLLGWLGRAESRRKHALHAAAVLAALGLAGSARGVPQAWQVLAGDEVARPMAAVVQAVMALLCLIFVVLAVRSFVAARRARSA